MPHQQQQQASMLVHMRVQQQQLSPAWQPNQLPLLPPLLRRRQLGVLVVATLIKASLVRPAL